MNLRDIRIKTKLLIGFAILAAVVVLVSSLALRSLGRSNDRFSEYLDGIGMRERLASEIQSNAMKRAIAARNLVLVTTPADRETERVAVTQAHEAMKTSLTAL